MTYEYRCRSCRATFTTTRHGLEEETCCRACGGPLRRVYSVSYSRPMQEHWNTTVNKPIRSERQFADELKAASDAATERTGIEHRFVPIDPSALGATQEGMDNTYRQERAAGKTESKLIL